MAEYKPLRNPALDSPLPNKMALLDNSGNGPLQVPGFGSIFLDYELPREARFAHGLVEFRHTPRLTAREMAMLRVMQQITEQPGWHLALLKQNEACLAQWHREAQAEEGFLLSAAAWDWFTRQSQGLGANRHGGLQHLHHCLPDVRPVQPDIQQKVAQLCGTPISGDSKDGTAAAWFHMVDPSLCPLVYGRTPVLTNGGTVHLGLWSTNEQQRKQPVETAPTHVHPLDSQTDM